MDREPVTPIPRGDSDSSGWAASIRIRAKGHNVKLVVGVLTLVTVVIGLIVTLVYYRS